MRSVGELAFEGPDRPPLTVPVRINGRSMVSRATGDASGPERFEVTVTNKQHAQPAAPAR